jgi:hypothetical protein
VAAARKANGQFEKGHSGNPKGRPKRATEERYIREIQGTVTLDDWRRILQVGTARAKSGDLGWAKFLADYLIGPPVKRTEITGADGKELTIRIIGGIAGSSPDAT